MHAAFSAQALALTLLSSLSTIQAGPSIDVNDASALEKATKAALQNLYNMYDPIEDGGYDQVSEPWWASACIWDMMLDWSKWSGGDTTFNDYAVGGLANMSFNHLQDVWGGEPPDQAGISGRWSDDALWVALAVQNGAEIYGGDTVMPGTGGGKWNVVGAKTGWQTWSSQDDKCGGGLYWARNPFSKDKDYKSVITNVQYTALAGRIFAMDQNQTLIEHGSTLWEWMHSSGLMTDEGRVYDGIDATQCNDVTEDLWTYKAGQGIQSAVWMAEATGDSSYLDYASSMLSSAQETWATNNNIIRELCEPQCARDSKNFKAIFVRSLAYLHRVTQNDDDKSTIETMLSSSINAMAANSCDDQWNCGGNWTKGNTFEYVDIADQHVSSALLVAGMGVFAGKNEGITPGLGKVATASAVSAGASAGSGPATRPVVESQPLGAAQTLPLPLAATVLSAVFMLGLSLIA